MRQYQQAFTLFEILIALAIFAILGLIVALGLKRTLDANHRVDLADKRLQTLEVAQALLRHDISQAIDRSITDEDGQTLPAFQLKAHEINFTRGGLTNPFNIDHRSSLQRINYIYTDHKLMRRTWPTLDRLSGTSPHQMTLLTHVTALTIKVYDTANQLSTVWPESHMMQSEMVLTYPLSHLPKAVKITY